jgi:hypothetical protein
MSEFFNNICQRKNVVNHDNGTRNKIIGRKITLKFDIFSETKLKSDRNRKKA